MHRWNILAASAAVVVGAALVTGASIPPKPALDPVKPQEVNAVFFQIYFKNIEKRSKL